MTKAWEYLIPGWNAYKLATDGINQEGPLFGEGGIFHPGAPKSEDLYGKAEQQGQSSAANIAAQTQANRPNQSNPYGSSNWTKDANGNWTQSSQFSGPMGQAFGKVGQDWLDQLGKPMMDGSSARDQAISAAYGQATSRLDPQWNQRENQARTRLMNQGLDPSSEAYANAIGDLGRERNDAYTSAMNSAIGQGTQAGSALFAQNLAARNNPLQELQGMQGLLGQQNFLGAGSGDPTQYLAAAMGKNNYQLQDQQQKNQFWTDLATGAMDFGKSAVGGGKKAG